MKPQPIVAGSTGPPLETISITLTIGYQIVEMKTPVLQPGRGVPAIEETIAIIAHLIRENMTRFWKRNVARTINFFLLVAPYDFHARGGNYWPPQGDTRSKHPKTQLFNGLNINFTNCINKP